MATKDYRYPLQVRVTEELHSRLSAMAERRGQSLTSAATIAILAEVERYEAHLISRSRLRDPVKQSARLAVHRAIRAGKLTRLPCQECGATAAEAHHDDYSKPLKVRWLCRKHHTAAHFPTLYANEK